MSFPSEPRAAKAFGLQAPRWARLGAGALALAALCGCEPGRLPADKSFYAGDWSASGASLKITARGDVKYRERQAGGELRLEGKIKEFKPGGFVAGPPSASAWFAVQSEPQRAAGQWRMVVGGREFRRDPGPPGVKERSPRPVL